MENKNVHTLPTLEPSRLYYWQGNQTYPGQFKLRKSYDFGGQDRTNQYIYITDNEEIKEGDKDFYILATDRSKEWVNRLEKVEECKIDPIHGKVLVLSCKGFLYADEGKKIILTNDPKLIADGIQQIDEEFLEWFVQNSNCECVEFELDYDTDKRIINGKNLGYYSYIIPKEEPKQETLEEAAERFLKERAKEFKTAKQVLIGFAEWQQKQDKNKFGGEDMKQAFFDGIRATGEGRNGEYINGNNPDIEVEFLEDYTKWFEQFKNKRS